MLELRPILFILGIVLAPFGAAMIFPAVVDLAVGNLLIGRCSPRPAG